MVMSHKSGCRAFAAWRMLALGCGARLLGSLSAQMISLFFGFHMGLAPSHDAAIYRRDRLIFSIVSQSAI